MKDICDYLNDIAGLGLIASDATEAESLEKTRKILNDADNVFHEAIDDKDSRLHGKIVNGKIKPETICTSKITEYFQDTHYVRPVVDLVQQGGGMYGIALLGYTYILEKVGIRFYSHGGTSAGAINASFLAAIPPDIYEQESIFSHAGESGRQATKSELLTHIISNTSFSSFMERDRFVGWLQQKLFKNHKGLAVKLTVFSMIAIFLVFIYGAFGWVFNFENGLKSYEVRTVDFVIGILTLVSLFIMLYIAFTKILKDKFGVNKGNIFYEWVDGLLSQLGVNTTEDLHQRMRDVKLDDETGTSTPRLVLIASNLTHNRMAKFPEDADDYWSNPAAVKPAAYLRATMSLPFIFETFIPGKEHYYEQATSNYIKLQARFVDGGMLSNFPIREFHKPSGVPPRFPTFGVLLSDLGLNDSKAEKRKKSKGLPKLQLFDYIGTYISTFRNFYDFDFIFGNKEIAKRVETVNTNGFNWLDFWMNDETKKALFIMGVHAAIRQLEKFDWEEYKTMRMR